MKCTAGQSGLVHEIGTGERLPSVTDGKRMGDRRRKDGNGVRLQNTGISGIVDAVSTSHFKPQQTAVTSRRRACRQRPCMGELQTETIALLGDREAEILKGGSTLFMSQSCPFENVSAHTPALCKKPNKIFADI